MPDFRSRQFLTDHIAWMIQFYFPRCIDERGGYFQFYALDGSIEDRQRRTLVASSRMVVSFCMAARTLNRPDIARAAAHGIDFLITAHRDHDHGGYAWLLEWDGTRFHKVDDRNHAYGLVHVMLAFAHAARIGIAGAAQELSRLFDLIEEHMRDRTVPLYREEFSTDWRALSEYRGQNSNMHACEALLAAHAATGERRYLDRAIQIAEALCFRSASSTKEMVYEHFDPDWNADYGYNRMMFADLYRPWGFQPGHQTEWAKFLIQITDRTGQGRFAKRARQMFDRAVALATDREFGGLVYGLDPDLKICNRDKYFWVQIESAAAAHKLAQWSGDAEYLRVYDDLWKVSWAHFVDPQGGSWFRQLTNDFRPLAPDKGTGGKDYHVIGACHDILGLDAL